jgi:hypothetical protein
MDPEELMVKDEQYGLLLNRTFSSGGPPHQLLAFGFCKILAWRPQTFVQDFSDLPLQELESLFERRYQEEGGEDKVVIAKALAGLRDAIRLPFVEAVPDPVAHATYPQLSGRVVGTTTPRDYYRTETPEESVSHWVYAVRRRIRQALSSSSVVR